MKNDKVIKVLKKMLQAFQNLDRKNQIPENLGWETCNQLFSFNLLCLIIIAQIEWEVGWPLSPYIYVLFNISL